MHQFETAKQDPSKSPASEPPGARTRRWLDIAVAGICVGFAIPLFLFAGHANSLAQLASMLMLPIWLLAVLVSVGLAIVRARREGTRALIPLALCMAALVIPLLMAWPTRSAIHAWTLPQCRALVRRMESGAVTLPESGRMRLADDQVQIDFAYSAFVERLPDTTLMLEIFTEDAFPVTHGGYFYFSTKDSASRVSLAHKLRARKDLGGGWFTF